MTIINKTRSETMQPYEVLLFYQFNHIEDLPTHKHYHETLAKTHHLKGRIYIAKEGLNGTVSGTPEDTKAYRDALHSTPLYASMAFKIDKSPIHAFNKLHVRIKDEIVNFSQDNIDPTTLTAKPLPAPEFYKAMQEKNTIIIDARNHYEYEVGHFKGALNPNINHFRDLPKWIDDYKALLKGKKILTYCTGGIRCEKLTSYMKQNGLHNVYQLEGGIITYGQHEQTKGRSWDGALYVFDKRMTVPLNQVDPVVIGNDHFTNEPCERYINCANPECNKKILCTKENEKIYKASCSNTCRAHPKNRYVAKHAHL